MGALYKGLIAAGVLSAIAFYFVTNYFVKENTLNIFFASLIGLVVAGLLVVITEYYTSTNYRPVKSVAQSSTTGHATNIIQGLAANNLTSDNDANVIKAAWGLADKMMEARNVTK